ncbi:xanthine dehydrogenase small subunit [Aquamicrobium segne]|uniref:Xanthine dehydrogenase small subunit n=1 Tax=Aquamicrobium segne TaxID=469547 RepID=A0ABW0GUY5_9HYPH
MAVKIRNELRFILNECDVVLKDAAPDLTLLDWLRLSRNLRGTKEGCAEGDCGACTVLVGKRVDGGLVYEGVNACIRFMGSLDGCHIVTIEHLACDNGGLHPVQQAMVDFHGSQCGFCTPGFVMALYGLWMSAPNPSDFAIEKALQGNLCRCTGYEPIIRSARAISTYGAVADDPLARERQSIAQRLAAMDDGLRVELGEAQGRFIVPANIDDLATVLEAEPTATVIAGATDVGLWVTKMMRDISPAIFIGEVKELRSMREENDIISIGACVTYNEGFAFLTRHIPALGHLIARIGGEQIRNAGTIGGNIANGSPIGDMPPALIALGSTLTLRKGSERRTILLEDFFIAYGKQDRRPGEFVEAVHVPVPQLGSDCHYAVHKISKRHEEDITATLGAFYLELEKDGTVKTVRIAYGGMAATPKRAGVVEAALIGKPWEEASIEAALGAYEQDFAPLSDMRATSTYRMLVAKNLLRRFYLETSGAKIPIRVSRQKAAA